MLFLSKKKKYEKIKKQLQKASKSKKKSLLSSFPFFRKRTHIFNICISGKHPILKSEDSLKSLKKDFPKLDLHFYTLKSNKHSLFQKYGHSLHTKASFFSACKKKYKGLAKSWKKYPHKTFVYILIAILILSLVWVHGRTRSHDMGDADLFSSGKIRVIFSDQNNISNSVQLFPLISYTQLSKEFRPTNFNFDETRKASGRVEIINNYRNSFEFIAKTRLATEDGVVYEISDRVFIPRATFNANGELKEGSTKVFVSAQTFDLEDNFTGSRGNIIKDTTLTFPSLDRDTSKIYARAIEDFTGGEDNITADLGDNDTQNFSEVFVSEMKEKSIYELGEITKYKTKNSDYTYGYFDYDGILDYDNIHVGNSSFNEESEQIKIRGSITTRGYYYDHADLEALIDQELEKRFGSSEVSVDPESIILSNFSNNSDDSSIVVDTDVSFSYTTQ